MCFGVISTPLVLLYIRYNSGTLCLEGAICCGSNWYAVSWFYIRINPAGEFQYQLLLIGYLLYQHFIKSSELRHHMVNNMVYPSCNHDFRQTSLLLSITGFWIMSNLNTH